MSSNYIDFIQKTNSIGMKNEKSLHSQIKQWYFKDGDKVEAPVEGYIVDMVRHNLLIEIQTKNLAAMKKKLKELLSSYRVRVIHPIAMTKQIVYLTMDDEGNTHYYARKSPKKGVLLDAFNELVRVTDILVHPNFELEILLIHEDEIRCSDGKGSWRRKGVSIIDRKLKSVHESYTFMGIEDYLKILPANLPEFFTTKMLSQELGTSINTAQKIVYCLKKINAIKQTHKKGNALVYSKF